MLSSLSTESSQLESSVLTAAPLQYSSTSCSALETMSYRGFKPNTTKISSTLSASPATDNLFKPSYGSLMSSTSRSSVDSSLLTSFNMVTRH